ncbi:TetR/AcrR family transcriptional regulator [Phenylobacterium sp.]|uniref:TetR/AcrR family transcriptional regulator n=1 Tax=Phenylobacterium sp. TaxID=1871053 RepID=UPI002F410BEA
MTQLEVPAARRSARKAKGDGYLRRAEILDAAERIFVAEGYDGATIRRIADEVGVSSTALYMHFPDKAAILMEICERTLTQLLDRNTELAAKPVDSVTRVRMMLEAYVRWGLQHPNAYNLVYSGPRPNADAWPEGTTELSWRCYEIYASVVREIAAAGRLRAGSADAAAQVSWMAGHGLVALLTGRPNFHWEPTEELIAVSLDGLMNGLVID